MANIETRGRGGHSSVLSGEKNRITIDDSRRGMLKIVHLKTLKSSYPTWQYPAIINLDKLWDSTPDPINPLIHIFDRVLELCSMGSTKI